MAASGEDIALQDITSTGEKSPDKAMDPVRPDSTPVGGGSDLPPISFTALFRYSTWPEILLDVIGILAAIGAGVAQVGLVSRKKYSATS